MLGALISLSQLLYATRLVRPPSRAAKLHNLARVKTKQFAPASLYAITSSIAVKHIVQKVMEEVELMGAVSSLPQPINGASTERKLLASQQAARLIAVGNARNAPTTYL